MKYDMFLKELKWDRLLFSSVFLTILQVFRPEVTLIRDQVLINVGAYVFWRVIMQRFDVVRRRHFKTNQNLIFRFETVHYEAPMF